MNNVPVIDLTQAPGERTTWGKPAWVVYLWSIVELLIVTNPWQVSSTLRVRALRAFGAQIANNVIYRPRTRVKFPWRLEIGHNSWIGEGVWIHNQDFVTIGDNAVISQDSLLTTGSHAIKRDMALITRPIQIKSGAWVTSRCVITGGSIIGTSAVIGPGSVVNGLDIPDLEIWAGNPISKVRNREIEIL
jgi:putative colanic acid biosynthesis acetyltransferase WcaF